VTRPDARIEPCCERCFRALPVANALGDDCELIAQVERITGIPETIVTEKGVGSNVHSTLVALDECLRLRDTDREECANSALDSTVTSSAVLGNRSHEVRDIVTVAPVTTDLVVAITPANVVEPTTLVQVTNDDRLN